MTDRVLEEGYATTDITDRIEPINEGYYGLADSLIAVNPDAFFTPSHIAQYSRPLKELPCEDKITGPVEALLNAISTILRKQGADYQVIIPPH